MTGDALMVIKPAPGALAAAKSFDADGHLQILVSGHGGHAVADLDRGQARELALHLLEILARD
jgi:hypothetical protein